MTKRKGQLFKLLSEFEELFDGTLGDWKTEPVELELREGEKPHSSRYYPMPRVHKQTFKKELLRLVEIGVLEEVRQSKWGSPTFIIPKKQGTVRFISDFRKLNAKIKRKPYPIPRISDVTAIGRIPICYHAGFKYGILHCLNWVRIKRSNNHCHRVWKVSV